MKKSTSVALNIENRESDNKIHYLKVLQNNTQSKTLTYIIIIHIIIELGKLS